MKTQVFKNNESVQSSVIIKMVSITILGGILLFANGLDKSDKSSEELMKTILTIPTHEITFSKTGTQELESEKLYSMVKLTEEALNRESETIKNPASGEGILMVKMLD